MEPIDRYAPIAVFVPAWTKPGLTLLIEKISTAAASLAKSDPAAINHAAMYLTSCITVAYTDPEGEQLQSDPDAFGKASVAAAFGTRRENQDAASNDPGEIAALTSLAVASRCETIACVVRDLLRPVPAENRVAALMDIFATTVDLIHNDDPSMPNHEDLL